MNVAIDPDGRELYVSYQCGGAGGRSGHDAIEIYDVNSEQILATIGGPPLVASRVSFAPHALWVLLDGSDACSNPVYDRVGCPFVPSRVFHLLRSTDRKIVKTYAVPGDRATAGVFSPDGQRIVFSGDSLTAMDPMKATVLERFSHPGESYGQVVFTSKGDRAIIPVTPPGILVLHMLDQGCLPPTQGLFDLYSGDGTLDDERQAQPLVAEGDVDFVPGWMGQAFHFNGKNSRLRVARWGACGGCGDSWSESLYLKFRALAGEMTILERVGYPDAPVRHQEHRLLKSADNRIVLEVGDRTRSGSSVSTSAPVDIGHWHHLAVVTDNGEQSLYVDGNMIGRIRLPPAPPNPLSTVEEGAYVGAALNKTSFLDGLVDELAFYNRALSVCVRATTRLTDAGVEAIGFLPRLRVSVRGCCE